MLRRLYPDQPPAFAFSPANQAWAEAQITKFPEGRQASAIIPLLYRAQEQEGWLSRPAIEHVADMLGMAPIRALEVATFYFMFQLQPVGTVAHLQICGTTPCMLCGAEDLIRVCKERIAPRPHQVSPDGRFSWEEVECLGACANAPMAQIGKDYFEDLSAEGLADLIERMDRGEVPRPGPQAGRFASEPASGLTSLKGAADGRLEANASVTLAAEIRDTLKRIDGTEVPLRTPWHRPEPDGADAPERDLHLQPAGKPDEGETPGPKPAEDVPVDETGITKQEAPVSPSPAKPREAEVAQAAGGGTLEEAAVGQGVGQGREPTIGETKPEGAGEVAQGATGRSVPEGMEARGGVREGNVSTGAEAARDRDERRGEGD